MPQDNVGYLTGLAADLGVQVKIYNVPPVHGAVPAFHSICNVFGQKIEAGADSLDESRQLCAMTMLMHLGHIGLFPLPPPLGPGPMPTPGQFPSPQNCNFVELLENKCKEYNLEKPVLTLHIQPYHPQDVTQIFTVRASTNGYECSASSISRRNANQLAAAKLYNDIINFYENNGVANAAAAAPPELASAPPPQQKRGRGIRELLDVLNKADLVAVKDLLHRNSMLGAVGTLMELANNIGLRTEFTWLTRGDLDPISLLELSGCSPALSFCGSSQETASRLAIGYMRILMIQKCGIDEQFGYLDP